MKKSKLKAIADALKQANLVVNAVNEAMSDYGKEDSYWFLTIELHRVKNSTYQKLAEMSGVSINTSLNYSGSMKRIDFKCDFYSPFINRTAIKVAFEYLAEAVPEMDLMLNFE